MQGVLGDNSPVYGFSELCDAAPFETGKTPVARLWQFLDSMSGALECDGVQEPGHTSGHLVASVEVTEQLMHDLWSVLRELQNAGVK